MRSTNKAPDFLSNSYLTGSPPAGTSVWAVAGSGRIVARGDEVDVHDGGRPTPPWRPAEGAKAFSTPARDKARSRRQGTTRMAHRLRAKVKAAEAGEALAPSSLVECRRDPYAGARPETLERRRARQRGSDRHAGLVERAALVFRGKPALVQVANVSKGGVTLACALSPE